MRAWGPRFRVGGVAATRGGARPSFDVSVGVEVGAVVVDAGAVDRVEVVDEPDFRQRQAAAVVAELLERLPDDPRLVLVALPLGREAGLVEGAAEDGPVVLAERREHGEEARLAGVQR